MSDRPGPFRLRQGDCARVFVLEPSCLLVTLALRLRGYRRTHCGILTKPNAAQRRADLAGRP